MAKKMSEEINLTNCLFTKKTDIVLLGNEFQTNSYVEISETLESETKVKTKLSNFALALGEILLNKSTVAYRSVRGSDTYYISSVINGENFECIINGSTYTTSENVSGNSVVVALTAAVIDKNIKCKNAFNKLQEMVEKHELFDTQRDEFLFYVGTFCSEAYKYLKAADQLEINVLSGDIRSDYVREKLLNKESKILEIMKEFEIYKDHEESESSAASGADKVKEINYETDMVINYHGWSEDQLLNIPNGELKSYIMTKEAKSIAKKIKHRMDKVNDSLEKGASNLEAIGNNYVNLLLVGEPGTGKTKMCYAIADMVKMPIYTIPISKNTEEDTFEGKNKVINGQISYAETDFIKAYEHGGIIVLEEINLADPAVIMGSLGQAIEFPFVVMKDGYIPIRRHPMCIIIATMNTGTSGSKSLNQALSSRFKQSYILADQPKDVFTKILASRYSGKKADCTWVEKAYTKIKNYLASPEINREDLSHNISMRACFGALENMEEGEDRKTAVINSIVGKIAESDIEIAKDVINKVVSNLPE